MILLIIFLPLMSSLFAGLFSRYIGRVGSSVLTTIIMFLNVILTLILFYKVSFLRRIYFINMGTWIYSDLFQVNWGFYIDNLTITMLLVVNIVSALVHLYSIDYMLHDPHISRFMSYLSLFTFFMLLLVTGDNFVVLFLGWEGVGLCSYLLISFWYTRIQANKAAIKALIVNRIADFALTIGIVSIFLVFKSLDFHVVFPLAPFFVNSTFAFLGFDLPVLTVICSLLFIGAMGKSAQIGLHTWLPDAMEGPTPVSALIHAATMVTAGVFLIIKCSPLFEYVPTVLSVITFVGATTAFFSATIGLVQNDIKKVIAYSTCSQLGYMIFACGLSNYHVSLFHLANHAFFKALLFLSAGAIIHSLSNEQDMRKFGGLALLLPFTSIMLLIGSLSLMGFPFLTGFYSKDLILEIALTKYTIEGSFAYFLGLITAFFTSFYSFRVFYMTFIHKNNGFRAAVTHVHELPWKMAVSLSVLSLGSIFFGYMAKDLFVGLGTDFWNHSILILPEHNNQLDAEFFGLLPLTSTVYTSGMTSGMTSGIPTEMQFLWNSTYSNRWIKLLPFLSSLIAVALVCLHFWNPLFPKEVSDVHKLPKNMNDAQFSDFMLTTPYIINMNHKLANPELVCEKWDFSTQESIALGATRSLEMAFAPMISRYNEMHGFEHVIDLYRPDVFFKEFKDIGPVLDEKALPFVGDDPLTPDIELVKNPEYYYYQRILWDSVDAHLILADSEWRDYKYRKVLREIAPLFMRDSKEWRYRWKKRLRKFYKFFIYKWYFDAIYNERINRPLVKMAYTTMYRSLDKGVLELFGPYGISYVFFVTARNLKKMQMGRVLVFAFAFTFWILVAVIAGEPAVTFSLFN